MFKRIFDRHKLDVTIISCGDTGQDIGSEMIKTLKQYGASITSFAITSRLETDHEEDIFDNIIIIDEEKDGFAKKLDDGIAAARSNLERIDNKLKKIAPLDEDEILLITTGAGATGLGSTLVITEYLYKNFKLIPPILTLLPEIFENSRVQYNCAVFLYRMIYKKDSRGNSILVLDNKPRMEEMKKPMSKVAQDRIETIPTAFADLLQASYIDSLSDELDASVDDLFDVMHTPGVAAFVAEELGDSGDEMDSSRIGSVIANSAMATTSLPEDKIFEAKNAFIALLDLDQSHGEGLSFRTSFEAKKLFKQFTNTHPFVKIVKTEEDTSNLKPKLRAIISGLPIPNRLLQIMRTARDSRKQVMFKENQLQNQVVPMNINRVEDLEKQVKQDKK